MIAARGFTNSKNERVVIVLSDAAMRQVRISMSKAGVDAYWTADREEAECLSELLQSYLRSKK